MTLRSNYYEKVVNTTDTMILSADPHRRSLLIQNPTNVVVNVRFDGAAAGTNSFYLTNGVPPLYLDYEMFGQGICREIHAIATTNPGQLAILEGYE